MTDTQTVHTEVVKYCLHVLSMAEKRKSDETAFVYRLPEVTLRKVDLCVKA
jgi:hypothetical protein